jgi:hypothetical protein
MKAVSSVVLSLFFVSLVAGHGWLVDPQPRGFAGAADQASASQTGPCGVDGAYAGTTYTIANYGSLTVQYNIGGGHDNGNGEGMCYFNLATVANQTNFDQGTFYTVPCTATNGPTSRNTTIFFDLPNNNTETLFFQFVWKSKQGGIWYNCAMINIAASDIVMNEFSVGSPVTGDISEGQVDYYRATLAPQQFVYIQATGPTAGSIDVALKSNVLPTMANGYDSKLTVAAGQTTAASVCSTSANNATGYISVTGDSGATGTYSFTASAYNGYIDFATKASPQISDSLPGTGSKFYYAQAYSTVTVAKRIVLRASGSVQLNQGTACTTKATPDATSDGNNVACLALSTQQGNKYIQVLADSAVTYTLGIEQGTCDSLPSSAVSVSISMFLVVLSFAALLL